MCLDEAWAKRRCKSIWYRTPGSQLCIRGGHLCRVSQIIQAPSPCNHNQFLMLELQVPMGACPGQHCSIDLCTRLYPKVPLMNTGYEHHNCNILCFHVTSTTRQGCIKEQDVEMAQKCCDVVPTLFSNFCEDSIPASACVDLKNLFTLVHTVFFLK